MTEALKPKLFSDVEKLPDLPGVYLFKNASGNVIYVGKAKSIKRRVKDHFLNPADLKHKAMLQEIAEIDHVVTGNEVEALLLEYNFIKRYRPKYNVLYRDDKSYPYLAVTLNDEWPRLILTRNLNIEGARYFGPYPKASKAREVLNSLLKLFPLRTCRGKEPGKRGSTPCLMYHLKKCSGPCVGGVSREEYLSYVEKIIDFLSGKADWLIEKLEREMHEAASRLEFEKAASIREKLLAARYVVSQQRVVLEKKLNADVFGFYSSLQTSESYVRVLKVRSGRIIGAYGFSFEENEYEKVIKEAVYLFYSQNKDAPDEILLPQRVGNDLKLEIENFLKGAFGKKIKVKTKVYGERAELLNLANENASSGYFWFKFQSKSYLERTQQALEELADLLKLKRIPLLIECYDMSGFKAENPVGSMVVFEEGLPNKNLYRKFKIKNKVASDYHKMLEVFERRFEKVGKTTDQIFKKAPDLVIIDGGKAQLSAAKKALEKIGKLDLLETMDIIAVAKPEDKVFKLGEEKPIALPYGSEALRLLQRIRDEAHRSAVSYFRKLEEKRLRLSILDGIKGIGPQRKRKLLEYFGDVEKMKKASLYELQKVVPRDVALRIKEVLNSL